MVEVLLGCNIIQFALLAQREAHCQASGRGGKRGNAQLEPLHDLNVYVFSLANLSIYFRIHVLSDALCSVDRAIGVSARVSVPADFQYIRLDDWTEHTIPLVHA